MEIGCIDGCLIKEGERCDKYLWKSGDVVYFIEFKGNDVCKALRQILRAVEILKDDIAEEKKIALIICSRSPKAGTDFQNELLKQDKRRRRLGVSIRQPKASFLEIDLG